VAKAFTDSDPVEEMRPSGLAILGNLPWGSHFCNFFDTKQDLLDILVPYFKAGLENNEFCLWITFNPVTPHEAQLALQQAIPEFDRYLQKHAIEILPHTDWYLNDGRFVAEKIIKSLFVKLEAALAAGYAGLRVNGNEAWLERTVWKNFIDYERALNTILSGHRIIVLCTYPLGASNAASMLDIIQAHEIGLTRRAGDWEIVEAPVLKQTKAQIKNLKDELEKRVTERTIELENANKKLKAEIEEHARTENALQKSEANLQAILYTTDTAYILLDTYLRIQSCNRSATTSFTHIFQREPQVGDYLPGLFPDEKRAMLLRKMRETLAGSLASYEDSYLLPNGSSRWYYIRLFPVSRKEQQEMWGVMLAASDITERKLLEHELEEERQKKQDEITDAVIEAEENNRREIGGELHDNINQLLAGAHMYLDRVKKDNKLAHSLLDEADKLVLNAVAEIRNLSYSLVSPFPGEITFIEALHQLTGMMANAGIKVDSTFEGFNENELSDKLALNLYRIIQEQFHNILKYAGAKTAAIKILQQGASISLTIRDDGRGIDSSVKASGTGLTNIKTRASLFNGEMNILSSPGKGFTLTVTLRTDKKL